jgi:hypothetical protein
MPYTVSGTDIKGVSTVTRKTPELALRKARELIKRGYYNVLITTRRKDTLERRSCGSDPTSITGRCHRFQEYIRIVLNDLTFAQHHQRAGIRSRRSFLPKAS